MHCEVSLLLECPLDDEAFFSLSEGGEHLQSPLSELLSEAAQIPFSFFLVAERSHVLEEHSQDALCLPVVPSCSLEN